MNFISLIKTKMTMNSNLQLSKYLLAKGHCKNCMQFKKSCYNYSYSTNCHPDIKLNIFNVSLFVKMKKTDLFRIKTQRILRYTSKLQDYRYFSTENKDKRTGKTLRKKFSERKDKFNHNKQIFINDIKETRNKMREKMEAIIERENVFTIPNLLCISRIIASPYLGYLIVQTDFNWALGILAFAGITDMLDGFIARSFAGQASKIGSFLDPMADKVLIATLFLTLSYVDLIPIPLTGLIIFRDVALVAAGFYIRYKSLPPPRTLTRYFDVTHATASLAPTGISKANTFVQLALVATTMAAQMGGWIHPSMLPYLWYMTAATTLASGLSYLMSRNTFHYLKDIKSKKDQE